MEKEDEDVEVTKITPKIAGMCAQVGTGLKESEMMKASAMLEELNDLEDDLTQDDLEYLQQHGHWKTVKAFANKLLSKMGKDDLDE